MKQKRRSKWKSKDWIIVLAALLVVGLMPAMAMAVCAPNEVPAFPGADECILDPLSIEKYTIPLVIPPVMNNSASANTYEIAVRQFQQQILPGGIWAAINPAILNPLPPTTVWSYGPASDPAPDASALGLPAGVAPAPNSQFNYPSYTFETMSGTQVDVRWINDLVDGSGNALPHLLPVDQTLHWANPKKEACREGVPRTDCATDIPTPYMGAVPLVTHVHGAHVDPDSDGYPEAWWLPAANDVDCLDAPGYPATPSTTDDDYACYGSVFTSATDSGNLGYADYSYRQDQPATTLWYHDHSLGMTRLNVYAGPAGFWLVRGGAYDSGTDTSVMGGAPATFPGPAPVAGDTVAQLNAPAALGTVDKRSGIREIPIVIQDRSFKGNGDLFYPKARAFFEGLNEAGGTAPVLDIPFVPDSDIAPIWNPEAFFTTMVVNGVTWPYLEVAPALYRFRLLNGSNSRFLNLALKKGGMGAAEIPFYQIGAEQGFLQQVVRIETGFATALPGDGRDVCSGMSARRRGPLKNCVASQAGAFPEQALLMGLAERADVIVDFRKLVDGDIVRMINTAPDAPFGGFPDVPADPATTGQVMQFVVNSALLGASPTDPGGLTPATDPTFLQLMAEAPLAGPVDTTRQVSLNEGESEVLCVDFDLAGNLMQVFRTDGDPVLPTDTEPGTGIACYDDSAMPPAVVGFPMAPKEALLGLVNLDDPANPLGIPLKWTAENVGVERTAETNAGSVNVWVTENPGVNAVEDWEIYNFTADAHPIHQHLVRFNVMGRMAIPGMAAVAPVMQPWENGFKDTVIAYPGEITVIRSKFDIAGLYVWHCHIVEHEDNEMMRPYFVGP